MRYFLPLLLLAGLGCSARRLPPGTPPPEYEPPLVTPWLSDAGAEAAPAPGDATRPVETAPGSELSPDAGVR
jgi:hypothetical protein